VWSSDGRRIAFERETDGNADVYVMNSDGSGEMRLTRSEAYDGDPAWSPDGTKIAFETDRDGDFELFVMNADGTGVTRLTRNRTGDTSPAWSPAVRGSCSTEAKSPTTLRSTA
jgi:Tol biopolymer transport system component